MTGTTRVRYEISTNKIGSECSGVLEFDADEWAALSETEQETEMREAAFNDMDWGYRVLREDEDDA